MSEELSLTRLYRPNNLHDYVGTKMIKDSVQSIFNQNKDARPRFIMIEGDSGLGKTTLARIIAKVYRCDMIGGKSCWSQGLKGKDQCRSCQLFDQYIETGSTDEIQNLKEVDIGQFSRINDLRDLLDELSLAQVGKFTSIKVVILDEVQSLGYKAQDALLKTIEEPEQDVLFIMCTTEPDKIKSTIMNRAGRVLHLQPPAIDMIKHRLKEICEDDDIRYSDLGLTLIASRFNDRIRNAVQTVDNVNAQYGLVDEANVTEYLDLSTVDTDSYFKFLSGVLDKKDKTKAISVLHQVRVKSDFNTFAHDLIDFVRRAVYVSSGIPVDGVLDKEMQAYSKLNKKLSIKNMSILITYLQQVFRGDVELNLMSLVYSSLEEVELTDIKPNLNDQQVVVPNKEFNSEKSYRSKQTSKLEDKKKSDMIVDAEELSKPMTPDEMIKLMQ